MKEESGYVIKLLNTTGIYHFFSRSKHQVILFHFMGEITGGSLCLEESEIIDSKWIAIHEIVEKADEELRNVQVIKQIQKQIMNERFYPFSVYKDQLLPCE